MLFAAVTITGWGVFWVIVGVLLIFKPPHVTLRRGPRGYWYGKEDVD